MRLVRPSAALAVPVVAAGLLAVARPSPPAARPATVPVAAGTRYPVVESPAAPANLRGLATALTPLVADYDGDGRSDVLWYGPGSLPDHLWLGRPSSQWYGVPLTIQGTFEPVVGDFNGDRRADVFWYAPGAPRDSVWFGRAGGGFTSRAISVGGPYQPLPGDFDGNGKTDVLWYRAGSGTDVLWLATTGGYFVSKPVTVNATYRPLLGDFDGDRRTDVFWYGAGSAGDRLWYGAGAGRFASRSVAVNGSFEPVVGDFDGDRVRDILWYGAGSAPDAVWYGRTLRGFASRHVTIGQSGVPVARDFDGDGRRDVLIHGSGSAADGAYYGRSARGGFSAVATTAATAAVPVAGDFNGDGRGDVLWYAAGNARDTVWSGYGRAFSGRATWIDPGHVPTLPLREESVNGAFNPWGFVAHAMGSIDKMTYTNTLEAFEHNYGRGFRVFEADQVVLADGTVVVAHDGTEPAYGLDQKFAETTWAEMAGAKYRDKYTVLRAQDLVALMATYQDAYFILDFKTEAVRAFATYVSLTKGSPALMDRLIPHVADADMLAGMRRYYPLTNVMVALYRTQVHNRLDDPAVIDWVRRERIPAVMMWHRQREWSLSLAQNNNQQRRYDAGFVARLRAAGAVPYVHSVDDKAYTTWLWERRIGVYTNHLFPPFDPPPPPPSPTLSPSPTASPSATATPEPTLSPEPTATGTPLEPVREPGGAEATPAWLVADEG